MTSRASSRPARAAPSDRGRRLRTVALAALLACVGARGLLSEVPYAVSTLKTPPPAEGQAPTIHARPANPSEVLRVGLACMLLAAAALWLAAEARAGAIAIRHRPLAALMGAFALASLASVFGASDRHAAWTAWIEQVSLMAACFTAAQMCRRPRARDLLLATVVAACAVLVVKSAWQVGVEFPASRMAWSENRDELLTQAGFAPDSPDARMLEKRMLAETPTGFGGLANPFASMMIVLSAAAATVAAQRFAAARAARRQAEKPKRGELHLPTLAATLTATLAAAGLAVVLLTRSRGAIAAMLVAGAGAAGAWRWRRWLGQHWRRTVLVVATAGILGAGAVIAHGLAHDSLPTRTMTFRWYYWTGSAGIIGQRPVLGAGPGNFPNAYLPHRRVEAEESVKMPHNFAVHALSQYGLGGGLCFVAIVAWVIAAASRPAREQPDHQADHTAVPLSPSSMAAILVGVPATALAGRWLFHNPGDGGVVLILDVIVPAILLWAALAWALWRGGTARPGATLSPTARILLVAGLGAFVLHNGVTFSLWMPGAALVFWTLVGLSLSQAPTGPAWRIVRTRWAVALVAAAGVAAAAACLLPPRACALVQTRRMASHVNGNNLHEAIDAATRAAQADSGDLTAALDAAVLALHTTAEARSEVEAGRRLETALQWANRAIERDGADARGYRTAAEVLTRMGTGLNWRRALAHMARAVDLDPMNMRLRIRLAEMLAAADRRAECVEQLRQVQYIDTHLPHEGRQGGSPMRLSTKELADLDRLRREANQ